MSHIVHSDEPLTLNLVPSTVTYRRAEGAKGATTTEGASSAATDPGNGDTGAPIEEPFDLKRRVLGDFILQRVMGRGGCGTVYRAEQRTLGRPAVVKVIRDALTVRRDIAARFAREARLASRFDHPYAAHVYAFGIEHDGLMWIAMELVDGTPLGELIRRSGPLPPDRFVPLFEQLCEVIQSAHDQGIIHRDIKPSNIMVISRAGRVMPKLLDFGVARSISEREADARTAIASEPSPEPRPASTARHAGSSRSLTHAGQVLGSPMYMAPEQWRDATTVGPLADQYALALVAYEVLTGARPFSGSTIDAIAHQHQHAPLPALPDHLPSTLHAVLARASDKRPEHRFAHLNELAAAVRRAMQRSAAAADISTTASPEDDTPYPGLAAYTAADHASYVGRERDVEELIDRLDAQSIVTVVGPSGSGKTSFLAAGVVPSLARSWRAELIRPGDDPLAALAAIATSHDASPYREAPRDASPSPVAIATVLTGLAETHEVRLVVIVDQAEELFTMCASDTRRAAFAEALIIACAHPQLRVVLSLRDDFLCRVEQLPAWRGRLGRAIHVLGPPSRDALERMITAPARRRGFDFDDPALPREIVDQVAGRPGALPLIAFTAEKLWENRDLRCRRLTREAYERLGGVIGALVHHADSVVDRMSVPDRRYVRVLFGRLITAEGTRALISRAELESSLGDPAAATVIDRLLAARLLVSHDDENGDRVEVIHETLATTWPRLASWRRSDADRARFQEQLTAAARHWSERGKPRDLLWRGEALAELRRWTDADDHSMTPVEQTFARACISSATRRRLGRVAIIAAAFTVLIGGIGALASANHKISEQRATAVARLRASFEERGRLAIADGDDTRAMLYLAEASKLGAQGPGFDLLVSQAARSLDAGLEIVGHDAVAINAVDIGPGAMVTLGSDHALSIWTLAGEKTRLADEIYYARVVGDLVVSVSSQGNLTAMDLRGVVRWTANRAVPDSGTSPAGVAGSAAARLVVGFSTTVTLWDLDTGLSRGDLPHDNRVSAVAVGGELVATGDITGAVRIWDTATRQLVAACSSHMGRVRAIRFMPDHRRVVTGGNDGEVRICDARSGTTLHRLIGHDHEVVTIDVTSDSKTIVSGGRDARPRVWDAETGLLVKVLEGHRGNVVSAQFSPDDRQILTLSFDGTARLWTRDGVALTSLQGNGGPLRAGRWDSDGHHVITTSVDGALRRWDPRHAIRTAFRQAHTGAIHSLAISRDDRWLLTAGDDQRARLWDRRTLEPVVELADYPGARALFGPDGTALTIDDTGTARIWQLPAGVPIAKLGPDVTDAAYTPAGQLLTAHGSTIRFSSPLGVELGAVTTGYRVDRLILDPAGRWLLAGGEASELVVIDVATRAPLVRLAIHEHGAVGLALDDSRIAISDETTMIRLWQIGSWLPAGVLSGHKNVVTDVWLLRDGRLVSTGADATLIWGRDGQLLGKLADTAMIFALATSVDATLFATTSADGAIRIWDVASHKLLLRLPAHRLQASALQFTHDGGAVISGGDDGRLVTWELTRRTRSSSELADIVRCRVPLRLEGDVALPRDLDFDDPSCRSLVFDR